MANRTQTPPILTPDTATAMRTEPGLAFYLSEDPLWYTRPDPSSSYRYTLTVRQDGHVVGVERSDVRADLECLARWWDKK